MVLCGNGFCLDSHRFMLVLLHSRGTGNPLVLSHTQTIFYNLHAQPSLNRSIQRQVGYEPRPQLIASLGSDIEQHSGTMPPPIFTTDLIGVFQYPSSTPTVTHIDPGLLAGPCYLKASSSWSKWYVVEAGRILQAKTLCPLDFTDLSSQYFSTSSTVGPKYINKVCY